MYEMLSAIVLEAPVQTFIYILIYTYICIEYVYIFIFTYE